MLTIIILGIAVGVVLGLTGAGGGTLAIPVLVMGLGWSMQQAAPVALLAVSASAAIGAIEGYRKGLVRYKAALLMSIIGIIFTTIGLRIANILSQKWLAGMFIVLMLFVAFRLLKKNSSLSSKSNNKKPKFQCLVHTESGQFQWSITSFILLTIIGGLTGFMTGLLGAGGGFVMVPLLRRYTELSMHSIVATSLMVIALVGSGSVINAILHGVHLPFQITLYFVMALSSGMLMGRKLILHLLQQRVQQVFGFSLILVSGVFILKIFS